ncbi:unnamed protein product [Pleuronectes platessa]|uniref:Uncharacterized protein n=1 Tax=Pleuronectes platessa TaxID=8262 RepID=A0A9N7YWT5_PLEPL|nr:unnamed protein product [Pleuronectes platessa]
MVGETPIGETAINAGGHDVTSLRVAETHRQTGAQLGAWRAESTKKKSDALPPHRNFLFSTLTEQQQARGHDAGGQTGPAPRVSGSQGTPLGEKAVTNNASVVQVGTTPCRCP